MKIVAPVVVKPDTDSKNASIKFGALFVISRGTAPHKLMHAHTIATNEKTLRVENFIFDFLPAKKSEIPIAGVKKSGIMNPGKTENSPDKTAVTIGKTSVNDAIERTIKISLTNKNNCIYSSLRRFHALGIVAGTKCVLRTGAVAEPRIARPERVAPGFIPQSRIFSLRARCFPRL